MPEDETTLLARARQGDAASFDALVRRYLERTFHVAFRLIGNREDAEDVTQETFVKAHAHLASFQGRAAFGTWVTSICVRLCLDHERRRRRAPPTVSLEGPGTAGAVPVRAPADPPGHRLVQQESLARLTAEVGRLPRRLRVALVLRVLQGLEYDEVAQVLGTTPRSARIYVSEARRLLAERLPPRGGGER